MIMVGRRCRADNPDETGAAATVVALTHSGWDRRADGAEARLSYDSGWEVVLGAYGSTAAT